MDFNTIESKFEYQAKEILKNVIEDYELLDHDPNKKLDIDAEELEHAIWQDYCKELGREFLKTLNDYNGNETLEEIIKENK